MDVSFYKGKRVLVTGHTGFKGSWLCRILIKAGAVVTGYSLEPPTDPDLFSLADLAPHMNSVIGDIRDLNHLKEVFEKTQPEIVLHLAAQPIVRDSYKDPVYTYETNVMGTVNICECVRQNPCVKSFLNVTTDKVYENKEWEWGYRENEPLDGFDPYSNSKSCSELVTHSYINSFFADRDLGSLHSESRQCDRRRRLCQRQDHPGLRACDAAGGHYRRKESVFHQTIPACTGTAWRLSFDRTEAV